MKTACSVLMIFGCTALMHAGPLAAQSNPPPQQSSSEGSARAGTRDPRDAAHGASSGNEKYHTGGVPTDKRPGQPHVPNKSRVPKPGNLTKPSRTKQPPTSRERSASGSALSAHHSDRSNAAGRNAVKSGLAKNDAIRNSAATPRPSRVVSHSGSLPNNQRHRGPNSAAIGGLAGANKRNAAAIDGTQLRRKH